MGDEIIEWGYIKSGKCKEYKCPACEHKVTFHPGYIDIAGCTRCEGIEAIAKRMLRKRGFEFISLMKSEGETAYKRDVVKFRCPNGHISERSWRDLRAGKGCCDCDKKVKPLYKPTKKSRPECNCRETRKGAHHYCEHYNFAVICPEEYKNWCHDLNKDIDAYKISPCSHKKAFFKCDIYNEVYSRKLNAIYNGHRCPFCFGDAVCVGNSLYSTHPEIAKRWHPDNDVKSWEVRSGTHKEYFWKCEDDKCNHKYLRSPHRQTAIDSPGCPKCLKTFAQRNGGFDYFVQESNKMHDNKYQYPDGIYINEDTHVNILCTKISKITESQHGIFSQSPSNHKRGSGCPKCAKEKTDSKGVISIKKILTKWRLVEGVHYFTERTIDGLKYKAELKLDFYIKENIIENPYPIALEFDHCQHFFDVALGWDSLENNQKRDMVKDLFCIENNINLIRIPYVHQITETYLSRLLQKCIMGKICYFSYKHYEDEIRKKKELVGILVETVTLPPRFSKIKCDFDNFYKIC